MVFLLVLLVVLVECSQTLAGMPTDSASSHPVLPFFEIFFLKKLFQIFNFVSKEIPFVKIQTCCQQGHDHARCTYMHICFQTFAMSTQSWSSVVSVLILTESSLTAHASQWLKKKIHGML